MDFLDHADIYGEHLHQCEERFAQAMALTPSQRDQVTIQTKAGIVKDGPYFDYSYEHLTSSVEGSLRALNTDRIDILLLHRPDALVERSEEHTSELQSRGHLVCRLLLEKKNTSHTAD